MAHLAKEREKLDAETFKSYSELQNKLSRLIYFVGEQLPPDAQETLLDKSFKVKGDDAFPLSEFRESYVLTSNGIKEVRKTKLEKNIPELETENIDALGVVGSVDPDSFKKICMNLQSIIDKHNIKVPQEYF